jgi:membrane protease YdiL (CAAX protease family)
VIFAAIVSSIVFGLFHTSWLVSGATPARTLAEIGVAFALGVMFAAGRYRTNSIWPVAVLHALTDFPGLLLTKQQVLNSGALGSNVLFLVAIALVYALILLRPSKRTPIAADASERTLPPSPAEHE